MYPKGVVPRKAVQRIVARTSISTSLKLPTPFSFIVAGRARHSQAPRRQVDIRPDRAIGKLDPFRMIGGGPEVYRFLTVTLSVPLAWASIRSVRCEWR